MTAGILRSIKYGDNMYRKLIKTDTNASEYASLDNNLRIYKTVLRKSIRLAKANYYANFRPISPLPAISKIFEKIVFNQVYAYFDRNKLLYTSQYSFRKLHSMKLALLELVDRVRLDIYSGKCPSLFFSTYWRHLIP